MNTKHTLKCVTIHNSFYTCWTAAACNCLPTDVSDALFINSFKHNWKHTFLAQSFIALPLWFFVDLMQLIQLLCQVTDTDNQARISRNMTHASSASSSLSSNFFNSGSFNGSVEYLHSSSCCRRLLVNCFDNVLFGGGLPQSQQYRIILQSNESMSQKHSMTCISYWKQCTHCATKANSGAATIQFCRSN